MRSKLLALLALLALPALLAGAARAEETPAPRADRTLERAVRVAVQDLEVSDVPPHVARVVADSLLEELRKLEGASVIGMDEVRQMLSLEAERQMLGCEEDESCLAEIAGALGADVLVVGSLARVGDEHVIALRRIDQKNAAVVATFQRRLSAESGEEFLATIGPAVEKLFPARPLRPGAVRGVPPEMALRLNPPPLPTWVFWTGAGVTSAAAAAAFGLLLANVATVGAVESALDRGRSQAITWSGVKGQVDTANTLATAAWVSAGVTVVLASATGVSALFVDWKGYGHAEE